MREHPHLYMTSTGLEEAPEKSSSSLTAMRAVEKCSSPEQHYSPEPRNQAYLLPYPVFQDCLLGLYLQLCTTETPVAAALAARAEKLWPSSCDTKRVSVSCILIAGLVLRHKVLGELHGDGKKMPSKELWILAWRENCGWLSG